jgi:type I restriction enzyme S subunit
LHTTFLKFSFLADSFQNSLSQQIHGGVNQNVHAEDIKEQFVSLPPIEEQTQIAHFLDHETTRIDALIAEQERLIELLKEKRQAVISHAVTKGLDPTVPMKDSGVEWLGDVPEHWNVCQSKHLLESVTSGSRGWAEFYSDDGYLFFRIANLTRDTINPKLDSKQFVAPPLGAEGERSRIEIDDILISITADLGSVCVANSDIVGGYVSQHVALARPCKKKVYARWLAYFVLSTACKEQLLGAGYGGTKIQLSLEDIKTFLIAVPSYKEQIKIAAFLDSEVSRFELLITEAILGIALLTERRSALISAAVTGKIDVRGWQAPANDSSLPTVEAACG